MSNPLDKHLANAFADFEGLRISGTIPLREELLNEMIAALLQQGVPAPTPSAAPPSPTPLEPPPTPPVKPDINALLKRVHKAQVRFENGRAIVDFEIGV